MQIITVNKKDLIEKVTANRDNHRAQFLRAQKKYREKFLELLDQRLGDVRDGKQFNTAFSLPEPVDYTAEYDTALAMLAWELEETVELSQDDFQKLVENKWSWARVFATNTQSYLVE